jgi:hypothetical protein
MSIILRAGTGSTPNANRRMMLFIGGGTIAVTTGSASVVGSGTAFLNDTKVGDFVEIAGNLYIITAIADATNLTLNKPVTTSTASGLQLNIFFRELMQDKIKISIVCHGSAADATVGNYNFGRSVNVARDGADVNATRKSSEVRPGQRTGIIEITNPYDWFSFSATASVNYSIILSA